MRLFYHLLLVLCYEFSSRKASPCSNRVYTVQTILSRESRILMMNLIKLALLSFLTMMDKQSAEPWASSLLSKQWNIAHLAGSSHLLWRILPISQSGARISMEIKTLQIIINLITKASLKNNWSLQSKHCRMTIVYDLKDPKCGTILIPLIG